MNLKIKTEEELVEAFKKLLHISVNLRNAQSIWEREYGVYAKDKKKEWEGKMDNFLIELGAEYGEGSGKEPIGIFYKS
jgi:hypothetical protein